MSVGHCEICYQAIDSVSYHCKKCYNDFHQSCIIRSMSNSKSCPMCREPLDEAEIKMLRRSKDSALNTSASGGVWGLTAVFFIVIAILLSASDVLFG
ncbi:MAG: RING finger domain-containing protein [Candidatus Kariarchaeaceae archaeon]